MRADSLPEPRDPEARLVETGFGPIAVADEGDAGAPPILCVHGIPGSRRDFRYLAPLLSRTCRVIRLEMPGFGSSPAGTATRLSDWGAVPVAVADALGIDRYTVLGHSFGGGAAILAAASQPERVTALVLVASMGGRRHRAFALPPWMYGVAAAALRVPVTRSPASDLARRGYRRLGLAPPGPGEVTTLELHTRLLASVSFRELGRALRATEAPALVAYALDDRLVEPTVARGSAALLAHGELLELRSGGHHLQKTRAREVAAAILDLLARAAN